MANLTVSSAVDSLMQASDAAGIRSAAGLGTTDLVTFLGQILSGQSLTGSQATSLLSLATTWNTTGTPTAIDLNVTDTASNAASLLMNLRVGGVSQFGFFHKYDSVNARPVMIAGVSLFGETNGSHGYVGTIGSGGNLGFVNLNGTVVQLNHYIGFANNTISRNMSSSIADLRLFRDGANILAQRNGVNAQSFRIYNTFTDASNFERLQIGVESNVFLIRPQAGGTGTVRVLHISGLPTSNPGAGILWNDGGTVKVGT
jgi:hypothetical protein